MAKKKRIIKEKIMEEKQVMIEEAPAQEVVEPEVVEPKELYTVRVTHPSLRRRREPSLQGEVAGLITDQGIYKIYE